MFFSSQVSYQEIANSYFQNLSVKKWAPCLSSQIKTDLDGKVQISSCK